MYYVEAFHDMFIVKKKDDEDFLFGPFNNFGDAWFIGQMFLTNKILFNKDEDYGKENVEDTHTVHEYASE